MANYEDEIKTLEQKKRTALFDTGLKSQENAAAENLIMPQAQKGKAAQKSSVYKSAYRQILEHDFTSQAWIGKTAEKRKHRKNINSNYKTVTGKKWTGLSSEEKDSRKKEFEDRRMLSLKASGQVADLLTNLNMNETFGDEENLKFLKGIPEVDTGALGYADVGAGVSSLAADKAFLIKFEEKMPMLHRAADLYERLLDDSSFPELEGEERTTVLAKLAYMKEVRSAYEDRIRIISSPYYVSLREEDFVGDAPENLENIRKDKKSPTPLRTYAASVLRWRNNGLSILQKGVLTDLEIGQNLLEVDLRSRKKTETPATDRTIDGLVGKIGVSVLNAVLNDPHDTASNGMAIKTAKDWVYSDLKKKVTRDEIKSRLKEMQEIAEKKIKHIEANPQKYIKEKEDSLNKDYEEKKKENPKLKFRVVTEGDVKLELKKVKNTLLHLQNIAKDFDSKEISEDVMKLWLDRGLQHDLRMGKQIYEGIVYQKYNPNRENDDDYGKAINGLVADYFHNLPGGVVTLQSTKTAYIRNEDDGKVTDKKAMYKNIEKYPERVGILTGKSDFAHIIGGNADATNITTRAYISAKAKYKSKAVGLFMQTVREHDLQDKVYFKITTKANQGCYGMDDITVFFSGDITTEEKKKILDTFYEKCNKDGENILEGKDMCVTGTKYKDGIALAPEPAVSDMLNTLFFDASKFNDVKRQKDAHNKDDKVRPNFSYNTFITSMFCQSAITANYMLGKSMSTKINVADAKTIGLIKKIFRQLCYLNGVDPEVKL